MHYNSTRDTLIDLGYIPLPIIPKDKRPAVKNWASEEYVPPKGYGGYGVGVKCGLGKTPIAGIDCDILDDKIANHMKNFILDLCGETIFRIGKAPKLMFVYRMETGGTRKKSSKHYESLGHVEFWGYGQQFVCFGIHPDTQAPYTWPSVMGDILDYPAAALPVLTVETVNKIIKEFEIVAFASGYKVREEKTKVALDYDPSDPLDVINPIGLKVEDCKKILDELDPDCGRDQWRNVGMALHFEFKGSPDAFLLWDEWSAKGAKYKAGEPQTQWDSFGKYPGRPITAAYLLKLTKKEDVWGAPDFFKSLDWSTSRFLPDAPALPMVVKDFLPKGIVSLFYSAGGAGKSTIVLQLAIKIVLSLKHDVSFLGHTLFGGKVVIITAEDPDLVLNRRFVGILNSVAQELKMDAEEIRKLVDENLSIVSTFGHAVQLFALKNSGLLCPTNYYTSLVACLKEISNLQLIIVDTKTRFSPGEGLGNVTATQEITYYEAMASQTGASVMLLHHSNKTSRDGSQGGSQAYRDATAIFDSVRAAWYFRSLRADELMAQGVSEESSNYFLLENSKNNYIQKCDNIIVVRDGFSYTIQKQAPKLTKEERKERKKQATYDRIIDVLQTAKGKKFYQSKILKACKDKIGVGRRIVLEALDDALADGLIEKNPYKFGFEYTLTEEGEKYNIEVPIIAI